MKFIAYSVLMLCFHSLEASVAVEKGFIKIEKDVVFEKKLELKEAEKLPGEGFLKETGYIVASTQSVYEKDRFISRWISLDDELLAKNKVNLAALNPSKNMAYGIINVSKDFGPQLKAGSILKIKRYGLKSDNLVGKILKVLIFPEQDSAQVHFISNNAPELIAGTTCEVTIEEVKAYLFRISLLSLLHQGKEDYIIVKIQDGTYVPKNVVVIDQDAQNATVLVPSDQAFSYVSRGAILLKPLLGAIVNEKDSDD